MKTIVWMVSAIALIVSGSAFAKPATKVYPTAIKAAKCWAANLMNRNSEVRGYALDNLGHAVTAKDVSARRITPKGLRFNVTPALGWDALGGDAGVTVTVNVRTRQVKSGYVPVKNPRPKLDITLFSYDD